MQIINLTDHEKSDIKYTIHRFPDGEIHLELGDINLRDTVGIHCRILNSNDLFILMQLSDIFNRQCVCVCKITIFYLMGARCDRLFSINRPFTLGIVTDVINSFKASSVYVFDCHSFRTLQLINNSHNTLPLSYLYPSYKIVAPDAGFSSRSSVDYAVICSKTRDTSGKIIDTAVAPIEDVKGENLLVVDDICDGGGTFMALAPKLRELNPKTLSLAVTHAIQLDGIYKVASVYDKVIITNSYKDWDKMNLPNNVEVINL